MMKAIDWRAVAAARARLTAIAEAWPGLIDRSTADVGEWEAELPRSWARQDREGGEVSDPKTSETMTLADAARLLGCHPATLTRAIRRGDLQAAKLHRLVRISRADLADYYHRSGGGALFGGENDE